MSTPRTAKLVKLIAERLDADARSWLSAWATPRICNVAQNLDPEGVADACAIFSILDHVEDEPAAAHGARVAALNILAYALGRVGTLSYSVRPGVIETLAVHKWPEQAVDLGPSFGRALLRVLDRCDTKSVADLKKLVNSKYLTPKTSAAFPK